MCKLAGLNVMVIFGGSGQASSVFNDVHIFRLDKEVWELKYPVGPGNGGSIPSARRGHTAVCLNTTMIVYGGGPDDPMDDDVWVLDASNSGWVWNRMTTNKPSGPGVRTGHSALLNGTNMLVWGGYGAPNANDTKIYILDTVKWEWSSPTENLVVSSPTVPVETSAGVPGDLPKNTNMPLTIGVVCGGLAFVLSIVGFLIFRRRITRRRKELSQDTSSFMTDGEQYFSKDIIVEEKSGTHDNMEKKSTSTSGKRSRDTPRRRSPQGYPMQSMAALAATDQGSSRGASTHGESSRSSAQYLQPPSAGQKDKGGHTSTTGSIGVKVVSISSDPYYPAYLAEDDEEDADRWTFASSLSFDHRDNNHNLPTLRYIPTRIHGAP
ncbi:F-box only protein 42 [Modicella reniformis]|uniref:F-box only protein 42 n=1 Tax=Modicella reniformis TaxID=1440133 RepID=A0A9P6SNI3_9FUNG|nr:F-box only protein 42 [Modicella reniformis]